MYFWIRGKSGPKRFISLSKLYIPCTLNTDPIFWHRQCIVTEAKIKSWLKSWVIFFIFQSLFVEIHSIPLLICTRFLEIDFDELHFLSILNLSFTACLACKIQARNRPKMENQSRNPFFKKQARTNCNWTIENSGLKSTMLSFYRVSHIDMI